MIKKLNQWWRRLLLHSRALLHVSWEKPKSRKRICSECGKQIRRHDRWFYFEDSTRHKDCANPTLDPQPPQMSME